MSKAHMEENRLDVLWRAHFVDRQVRAAIEQLFSADGDMLLVNHVQRNSKDLTVEEIRSSLARCEVRLDFPLVVDGSDLPPAALPKRGKRKRGVSKAEPERSLKGLIDAGALSAPLDLHKLYMGKQLKARVERNGSVTFGGKQFDSPSAAGSAALASLGVRGLDGSEPSTNGWRFWRFMGPDGEEHLIGDLRHKSPDSSERSA